MSRKRVYHPLILTLVLLGLLQVPGLHAYAEYLPYPWLGSGLLFVLFGGLYYTLVTGRLFTWIPLLAHRWLSPVLLLMTTLAVYFVYPEADALKYAGGGSTADNALNNSFRHFLTEGLLYQGTTLKPPAPISSGPGWVLFNGWFDYLNVYFLFAPLYMGITLYFFHRICRDIRTLNLFCLLYFSTPIAWVLLLNGHDLVPASFAFVLVALLAYRLIEKKSYRLPAWLSAGALAGIIATSRIPYIAFPLLLTVFVYQHHRRSAVILLLSSLGAALALHALFYMQPGFYEPLHVIQRANTRMPGWWFVGGILASLSVGFAMLYSVGNSIASWLFWLGMCLYVAHFFIAFGELIGSGFDFVNWEGAWYLMLPLPALLIYLSNELPEKIPR